MTIGGLPVKVGLWGSSWGFGTARPKVYSVRSTLDSYRIRLSILGGVMAIYRRLLNGKDPIPQGFTEIWGSHFAVKVAHSPLSFSLFLFSTSRFRTEAYNQNHPPVSFFLLLTTCMRQRDE